MNCRNSVGWNSVLGNSAPPNLPRMDLPRMNLKRLSRSAVSFLAGLLGVSSLSTPSHADTLQEVLFKAYHTSPILLAARAGHRAMDENIAIEKSAGFPNLSVQGGYQESLVVPSLAFTSANRQFNFGGRLTVPIYRGGAVLNAVAAAYARIQAGQANLRVVESDLFTRIVAAYMDVIRDQAIVRLNRNNVAVLEANLAATRDRFEIGDLTRTDVAQSEARLALIQGQMRSAEARLIGSRENYISLVGQAPNDLEKPKTLPNLPTSIEQAVVTTLDFNPNIKIAEQQIKATKRDIAIANARRLPSVSATIDGNYTNFPTVSESNAAVQAGLNITFPLYQGGGASALVRQNIARNSQAIENYIMIERQSIAQVRSAYASWKASTQVITATQAAVRANSLSLEGVRAENIVGSRSILDILNAEQEYLNAQVQLVTAQRDSYVAAFVLLAAMGRAEARDLGIDETLLYDPTINFRKANRHIKDWSYAPRARAQSTSTASIPAADAMVPEETDTDGDGKTAEIRKINVEEVRAENGSSFAHNAHMGTAHTGKELVREAVAREEAIVATTEEMAEFAPTTSAAVSLYDSPKESLDDSPTPDATMVNSAQIDSIIGGLSTVAGSISIEAGSISLESLVPFSAKVAAVDAAVSDISLEDLFGGKCSGDTRIVDRNIFWSIEISSRDG